MSEAIITPEVVAAAFVLREDDDLVESGFFHCGTCGDDFEVGQQALTVYAPWADLVRRNDDGEETKRARAVETIHLRCYQGEEVSSA